MKTVIKGAFYYDRDSDTILVPHFTGEFHTVDCSVFATLDELKSKYDEEYIRGAKENPVELEGAKYYSAEYYPRHIGEWELLSDLSYLEHIEEDFDF